MKNSISKKDLKEVRKYMKRNSGTLQMMFLEKKITDFSDNCVSIVAMHRFFNEKGSYDGTYQTFLKDLKQHLPEIYKRYSRGKSS